MAYTRIPNIPQDVPVIIRNSPNRIMLMRWGLIPHWAKDESIGNKMINARAETITEKPSFRGLLRSKRCIVPASGFYEWQDTGNGKQPFYIHADAGEYLPFAGLYDIWKNPEGTEIYSFTIITTQPTVNLQSIHNGVFCISPNRVHSTVHQVSSLRAD